MPWETDKIGERSASAATHLQNHLEGLLHIKNTEIEPFCNEKWLEFLEFFKMVFPPKPSYEPDKPELLYYHELEGMPEVPPTLKETVTNVATKLRVIEGGKSEKYKNTSDDDMPDGEDIFEDKDWPSSSEDHQFTIIPGSKKD
jgi:hypothetical protein